MGASDDAPRRPRIAWLWTPALLALGCALADPGPRAAHMVAVDLSPRISHPHSVRVQAAVADPSWSSMRALQLREEELLRALRESLIAAESFSAVVTEGAADYSLALVVTELEQPFGGSDITVGVVATWTLTDLASAKAVLEESISTNFTAAAETAFSATERVRIATEQAVQANLRAGIRRIGALKLTP